MFWFRLSISTKSSLTSFFRIAWSVRFPVLAGAFSLLCSVFGTQLFGHFALPTHKHDHSVWQNLLAPLLAMVIVLMLVVSVIVSLVQAFRKREKRQEIFAAVIAAYLAVLLIYAGAYYTLTYFGDLIDSDNTYSFYRWHGTDASTFHPDRPESLRSFTGMKSRLWRDIYQAYDKGGYGADYGRWSPTSAELVPFSQRWGYNEIVTFDADSRVPVFLDCVHFSVVTMATVGYGDIVPSTFTAKLVADSQILCGVALLVVALGMVFGDWWGEKNK